MTEQTAVEKGWYDQEGRQRYWDGEKWTNRWRESRSSTVVAAPAADNTKKVSAKKRREILDQQVTRVVAAHKGRVAHQTDTEAVIVTGKPVNHVLHVILSVLTLGFWLIVWFFVAVTGGEKKCLLNVDEYGQVTQRGP